jgi:hypothetical protein
VIEKNLHKTAGTARIKIHEPDQLNLNKGAAVLPPVSTPLSVMLNTHCCCITNLNGKDLDYSSLKKAYTDSCSRKPILAISPTKKLLLEAAPGSWSRNLR